MGLFALQFLVTNILFSVLIALCLIRLDKKCDHSGPRLLLYSLGLGPIVTTLLLYYLFLFVPGKSDVFYLIVVGFVYGGLAVVGRRQWRRLGGEFRDILKKNRLRYAGLNAAAKMGTAAFVLVLTAALALFLFIFLTRTIHIPLDDSDALQHGTLGKILYREKSLEYRWVKPDPKTGFYQTINSAPSFSLLLTWDKMTAGLFKVDQDVYFKSTSAYYALLILIGAVAGLARRSKAAALAAVIVLLSAFPFFITLFQQHLDSFRIYFLLASWICLAFLIEKDDLLSFVLFGLFTGFASFAHTIGAICAIFNVAAYLLFVRRAWPDRLRKTCILVGFVFAFGWIHYLLDIVWGLGWIVFYRAHTYWG